MSNPISGYNDVTRIDPQLVATEQADGNYTFPLACSRKGFAGIERSGQCFICCESTKTLHVDTSEGEYGHFEVCLNCVKIMFRQLH